MTRAFIIPPRKTARRPRVDDRPVLQLPMAAPVAPAAPSEKVVEPATERGIAIIDFYI